MHPTPSKLNPDTHLPPTEKRLLFPPRLRFAQGCSPAPRSELTSPATAVPVPPRHDAAQGAQTPRTHGRRHLVSFLGESHPLSLARRAFVTSLVDWTNEGRGRRRGCGCLNPAPSPKQVGTGWPLSRLCCVWGRKNRICCFSVNRGQFLGQDSHLFIYPYL